MTIFFELGVIIIIAAAVSALMRILRQPLVVGYILTGILVSPAVFHFVRSTDTIYALAQIGIVFLLFIVGLHLNPRSVKEISGAALLIGVSQIIITVLVGLVLIFYLGFDAITGWYLAIALSFSSTIVIMKLLSDKNELETVYGRITVGLLLVQDIAAIGILMVISSFSRGVGVGGSLIAVLFNSVFLIFVLWLVIKFLVPHIDFLVARSQETLFLFSLAWVFAVTAAFVIFGFSLEMGALAAGIALSVSPYQFEISAKVRPLRDFFIILFFVLLGLSINLADLEMVLGLALVLSLFVLVAKPFFVMIIAGLAGFSRRTGFMTGAATGQISEFSFVLVALGVSIGQIDSVMLPLIALVSLITIAGSSYSILYAERLYPFFSPALRVFERATARHLPKHQTGQFDVILFGYNRIGFDLLKTFRSLRLKFLVVDFNPAVIKELEQGSVPCRYGDADDSELLEQLDFSSVKMIVSTVPDFETNMILLHQIKSRNKKIITILVAHQINEAEELYGVGATYVLLPHFLGGEQAAGMIKKFKLKRPLFLREQKKHRLYIAERRRAGHEHPIHEKRR